MRLCRPIVLLENTIEFESEKLNSQAGIGAYVCDISDSLRISKYGYNSRKKADLSKRCSLEGVIVSKF